MILPAKISIQVIDPVREPAPNVLVSLHFRIQGRFYYSQALGLTNQLGEVASSGEALSSGFVSAQSAFPMDLKVPLDRCDQDVIVSIAGGREFLKRREGLNPTWVRPEWIEKWKSARNEHYESVTATVRFLSPEPITTRIELRTSNAGPAGRTA